MQIKTLSDIKKLGTILCVFAHPDDETFTMGGILSAAASNGQKVIVITATKGEHGVQDENRWPQAYLAKIRSEELAVALEVLGVKNHHFLSQIDGSCSDIDASQPIAEIAGFIRQYNPTSIFTFGPDGMTGHTDHSAVSGWAEKARCQADSQAHLYHAVVTPHQFAGFADVDNALNFFFATNKPPLCEEADMDVCLQLSDELYDKKMSALAAMPSQYDGMFKLFPADDLRGGFGVEAFKRRLF